MADSDAPTPEYVRCIGDSREVTKRLSLCGKRMNDSEFYFLNIEHWFTNTQAGGRLLGCRQCAKAIWLALENGVYWR